MNNIIVIDNLSFKYENNVVFDGLSLAIKKGTFTTILGKNFYNSFLFLPPPVSYFFDFSFFFYS